MKPIYRRILIFVAALAIVGGGYVVYRFVVASRASVPQAFSEARADSALISEKIVKSSNDVAVSIALFSKANMTPAQASSTLRTTLDKTENIRAQALELLGELETMARALPEIRSDSARRAAFDSISRRLTIVTELVAYTDKVKELTELLRAKFTNRAQNAAEIERLVKEINGQIATINRLNREANESMDRFDSLLREGGEDL